MALRRAFCFAVDRRRAAWLVAAKQKGGGRNRTGVRGFAVRVPDRKIKQLGNLPHEIRCGGGVRAPLFHLVKFTRRFRVFIPEPRHGHQKRLRNSPTSAFSRTMGIAAKLLPRERSWRALIQMRVSQLPYVNWQVVDQLPGDSSSTPTSHDLKTFENT